MLFCVFEGGQPSEAPARHALADVDEILIGRGETYASVRPRSPTRMGALHLSVPDSWMSTKHARIFRSGTRWTLRDRGSKNKTYVNGIQYAEQPLADGDLIELGQTFFIFREALTLRASDDDDFRVFAESRTDSEPVGLHTLLPALSYEFDLLREFAISEVSIVVLGESGTGKDILARAIHKLSQSQRQGRYVPVNCGAIPSNLVESELFGYVKGAFSGATKDYEGLIRAAHQGTLFLDEIGDMPKATQVVLLRVLQEREVRPVGSNRTAHVDFRVVAATHQPLEKMVEEGGFRDDLWARLSEFKLKLPPLRERREDLGIFVSQLLRKLAGVRAGGVTFSNQAARALFEYHWPRNVRELEKGLKTSLVLAKYGQVQLEHLPRAIGDRFTDATTVVEKSGSEFAEDLEQKQHRDKIVALLEQFKGNVTAVAKELKEHRTQVQRWIDRYRIDVSHFRRRQ